jgi:hypothetical protein
MSATTPPAEPVTPTQPTQPTQPIKRSREELRAEIEQTRTELAATAEALATQLSPKYQANRAKDAAVTAAADTAAFITGNGLPQHSARRTRNAKVFMGAVAAVVGLIVVTIIAKRFSAKNPHRTTH